jgi:hypothetical protein
MEISVDLIGSNSSGAPGWAQGKICTMVQSTYTIEAINL